MDTVRVTDPLWRESTGDGWLLSQRASDAEICFLYRLFEYAVEQTVELAITQDSVTLMWRHGNAICNQRKWETEALHYNDVIMSAMASQITSLTIVYSTVYSWHRSNEAPKLRVTYLCEGNSPVIGEFPHKGPASQRMLPFDDGIWWFAIELSWSVLSMIKRYWLIH